MKNTLHFLLFLALVSVILATGCSRQQVDQATGDRGVVHAGSDELSDAAVTARVKSALVASDRVDTSQLNVDTENRVVYLRGAVPDEAQKLEAEQIARDNGGTGITVRNELRAAAEQPVGTKIMFPSPVPFEPVPPASR